MIDIHTHILPCIDDGSQSVEETLKMLDVMVKSGVKKVVATPHYYPELMSVEDFLVQRQEAYKKIEKLKPEGIEIVLGAEVMLGYDLHKEDLRKLVIGETDYILIEMPYGRWDPWVFNEVFKISAKHGLEIIVAHIDRYVDIARKEDINQIFKMNLNYQVNVDRLGGFLKKSPALKMMKDGAVHFIGSDCHNTDTRVPCIADAVEKIKKSVGWDFVEYCMSNAERMLQNKGLN